MSKGSALQANRSEAANEAGTSFPVAASNSSDTILTFLNDARQQKKSTEVCFYLGAMLQSQGRHKEAAAQYQKAIDLGYFSAPVVIVEADGDVAHWSGFKPDRIKALGAEAGVVQ